MAKTDDDHRYFVFTNRETGADLVPRQQCFAEVKQAVWAANRPRAFFGNKVMLPLHVAKLNLDVLLNPGFTSPIFCGCPTVTVFHDLQHIRHPEHFRWFDLPFWRMLLFASAHRSNLLLADSEATRRDLLRFYRLPHKQVRTVHLGVDPEFFQLRRSAVDSFLLSVSTLHPHKNLDRLLQAFFEFRRIQPGYRLVVAGLKGFQTDALYRLRDSLNLADSVEFTGGFHAGSC